jgi:hypothetical protein
VDAIAERVAVFLWRYAAVSLELEPELCRRGEADQMGDPVDAVVGVLQEFLGSTDAYRVYPLHRGVPGLVAEAAVQGPGAEPGPRGDVGQREAPAGVGLQPLQQRAEAGLSSGGAGAHDELRLAIRDVSAAIAAP